MKAGFAEIDITPPIGTHKIGCLKIVISDSVLDPLYARAAVFESNGNLAAFVQLDTLSVPSTLVKAIREHIETDHSFPGANIMVAATHNHAGPAVADLGDVKRDDTYTHQLVEKISKAFGDALAGVTEAELAFGQTFDFDVTHNRRVVMRDGTVRTHGSFKDPTALYLEGPIDPEVFVLFARNAQNELLGAIVNYACHPTHHLVEGGLSAGFPGVLADEMRRRGCPVTLFLNGASGDLHTADPVQGGAGMTKEQAGQHLADDVDKASDDTSWRTDVKLFSASKMIELPYRETTEEQIRGTVRGAQRFVDPTIYDRGMESLLEEIRQRKTQTAEVQVIRFDEFAFASVPAEYFVRNGLRIKLESYPVHALIVSCANGMVGYVPDAEAFRHGGYETTFASSSKLAPSAGTLLADAAIELIEQEGKP